MSVQSGSALLTAGATFVAPIVQVVPAQLSANRLIAPSGVAPSDKVEPLWPMLRPPQLSVLMDVLDASNASPQCPPKAPRVKSRTVGSGGGTSVVVVEPDTDVVVVVDVDEVVLVVLVVVLVVLV